MPSPLREIEKNTPEAIVEQRWMVWTLADDVDAYGANAGKCIITTEDGEEEVTSAGKFASDVDAQELVDEHNARFPAPTPKTWLDIAIERGAQQDAAGNIDGGEFVRVGVAILNGCPGCGATVAPYNSYQIAPDNPYAYCADCAGVRS